MATRYNLTPRDVQAIHNTAAALGIRAEDLAAVMHYETIGTMNPAIKGGKGGNYQGLIQFGPSERRRYGYDASASFAEQVEGPVYRYLKDRGLQPGDDVGRLYRTINGGNRNARLTANDGNGTIAQHIERIKRDSLPVAAATIQSVPAGPDMAAIMDVASRNDGTSTVPDQATASMGYAPDLGGVRSAPAQMAIADMLGGGPPSPAQPPQAPPQWAQASGFPIDESLSGRSAQDVLMGGPRSDPRRMSPGTGPMPADMGAMLSPADVLAAGPRMRPGGAPDASAVPMPQISPFRPAMGGPADRRPQPPTPTMRPGGAPDASMVPNPPPRAQGIPNPPSNPRRDPYGFPIDVTRPRVNNPDGSFSTERTTTFDAAEVGLPPEIVTVPTIVNGRQVSEDEARALFAAGQNPPVQRGFDSFAAADKAAEARTGSIAAARATNGERGFPQFWGPEPQPLSGGMSAEMGNAPPPSPPTPPRATREFWNSIGLGSRGTPETQLSIDGPPVPPAAPAAGTEPDLIGRALDLGQSRRAFESPFSAGELRPQSSPPPMPGSGSQAYGPLAGPSFDFASPNPSRMGDLSAAMGGPPAAGAPKPNGYQTYLMPPNPPSSFDQLQQRMAELEASPTQYTGQGGAFPVPPSPNGPQSGALTNEGAPSSAPWSQPGSGQWMTGPPTPPPGPMVDRFNDAFGPGGGQIMDLQAAFNRQNAPPPPTMNAQDGIDSVFGAPPAAAMPPNLAIPFAEVPRPNFDFAGPSPASAANITNPLPTPGISRSDFDARFAGGTVAPATPTPGVTPGVVSGQMPQPMDIRPPAQGGPPPPPVAVPPPTPPAPRQRPATQQQRQGIARLLGGLLGGPIGALGGGLLGGGGGGFGFGQPASFAWSGGGSAPYGNGGSTNYQTGTSNALGGSNALSWQGSKGQTVTVVQDPWSGQYLSSF